MDRTEALLQEQVRLLKKSDRRAGCLWNLVMLVFFGIFYVAWLIVKNVVKFIVWIARLVWRGLKATWRFFGRLVHRGA